MDGHARLLQGSSALSARAPAVLVRPLRPGDRAQWEPLWNGYLAFYETSVPDDVTEVAWSRIHDPAEPMFALGAVVGGQLAGIAHYLFHRSFWTIADYCYLQDLFVAPDQRGGGIGRALIAAVEEAARAAGVSRMHWLTQDGNHTARALYNRVAERSGFIQYRKLF